MITQPFRVILLVASFLCFVFAATTFVVGENRQRVVALGLACAALALVFG